MGYSKTCAGTPAEGSPYMWPMAWRAHVESKSMAFGSDDVMYHSKGIVSYRLDKNWKRQDWYYQRGVQRGIGQAPCAPENIDMNFSEGPLLTPTISPIVITWICKWWATFVPIGSWTIVAIPRTCNIWATNTSFTMANQDWSSNGAKRTLPISTLS